MSLFPELVCMLYATQKTTKYNIEMRPLENPDLLSDVRRAP